LVFLPANTLAATPAPQAKPFTINGAANQAIIDDL